MKNIFTLIILSIALTSCSFFKKEMKKESLEITSSPSKVSIYTDDGDLVGITPLTLDQRKIKKLSKNGSISFSGKKINYIEKDIFFKKKGLSKVHFTLYKMSKKNADQIIQGPLSEQTNKTIKEILRAQNSIIKKDYSSAEKRINSLIKDNPNISSLYLLKGIVITKQKKYSQARKYIKKSITLDESNEIAKSYLNYLNKKVR